MACKGTVYIGPHTKIHFTAESYTIRTLNSVVGTARESVQHPDPTVVAHRDTSILIVRRELVLHNVVIQHRHRGVLENEDNHHSGIVYGGDDVSWTIQDESGNEGTPTYAREKRAI